MVVNSRLYVVKGILDPIRFRTASSSGLVIDMTDAATHSHGQNLLKLMILTFNDQNGKALNRRGKKRSM